MRFQVLEVIPILIILTTEQPLPASPWQATVYTHLGYGDKIPNDPPKSPRFRAASLEIRGTLSPVPPFTKGGVGGIQTRFQLKQDLCINGSLGKGRCRRRWGFDL